MRGHYSGVTNDACLILMSMFKILKRDVEVHICICQSDKCYLIPLNTKWQLRWLIKIFPNFNNDKHVSACNKTNQRSITVYISKLIFFLAFFLLISKYNCTILLLTHNTTLRNTVQDKHRKYCTIFPLKSNQQ